MRLGVGPTPIPQQKLTVESLSQAIETVMNDTTIRDNAVALSRRLNQENGTSNAVSCVSPQ